MTTVGHFFGTRIVFCDGLCCGAAAILAGCGRDLRQSADPSPEDPRSVLVYPITSPERASLPWRSDFGSLSPGLSFTIAPEPHPRGSYEPPTATSIWLTLEASVEIEPEHTPLKALTVQFPILKSLKSYQLAYATVFNGVQLPRYQISAWLPGNTDPIKRLTIDVREQGDYAIPIPSFNVVLLKLDASDSRSVGLAKVPKRFFGKNTHISESGGIWSEGSPLIGDTLEFWAPANCTYSGWIVTKWRDSALSQPDEGYPVKSFEVSGDSKAWSEVTLKIAGDSQKADKL